MGTITHASRCNHNPGTEDNMAASKWINQEGPDMTISPQNIAFIRKCLIIDYYLFVFLFMVCFPKLNVSPQPCLGSTSLCTQF